MASPTSAQQPEVSARAAAAWKNTKKRLTRASQRAKERFGKGDVNDTQYKEETSKFRLHKVAVQKTQQDIKRYLRLFRELCAARAIMADSISAMIVPEDPLHSEALKFQETSKQLDTARNNLEEQLGHDLLDPTTLYLTQFSELKGRLKVVDARHIDMARQQRHLRHAQKKNDADKMDLARTKLETATTDYRAIHDEVLQDVQALFDDRSRFFGAAIATLAQSEAEVFRHFSDTLEQVASLTSGIDKSALFSQRRVVESSETSAAGKSAISSAPSVWEPPTTGSPAIETLVAARSGTPLVSSLGGQQQQKEIDKLHSTIDDLGTSGFAVPTVQSAGSGSESSSVRPIIQPDQDSSVSRAMTASATSSGSHDLERESRSQKSSQSSSGQADRTSFGGGANLVGDSADSTPLLGKEQKLEQPGVVRDFAGSQAF